MQATTTEGTSILTRRYKFAASHRLHAACLSAQDNTKIFGKVITPMGMATIIMSISAFAVASILTSAA